jgi:hypothetical protein
MDNEITYVDISGAFRLMISLAKRGNDHSQNHRQNKKKAA